MKKKILVLLVLDVIVFALFLAMAWPVSIKVIAKPMNFCMAPYDWGACQDWSYKGIHVTWGPEKDENFISLISLQDLHMIWNDTATYDRSFKKTLMIQSSLLGDTYYGDCSGWGGICYKYLEVSDTFKP